MVDLETAIEELNTGAIEFNRTREDVCTTEGEVVIMLERLVEYEKSKLEPDNLMNMLNPESETDIDARIAEFLCDYSEEIKSGLAKREVLEFIARFVARDYMGILYETFTTGYCFYFAHMLKMAFSRGYIALVAPKAHIVWVDNDGCAYDIGGIYKDYLFEIPVDALGDGVEDFMHVPNKNHFNDKNAVIELCKKYAPNEELLSLALDMLNA